MPIADPIRDAIRNSGKSVTAIARATGIPQPVLSRFMNGGDVRVQATAEKLASYFGLRLCDEPPSTATKGRVKAPALPAVDWGASEPARKKKSDVPPPPDRPKRK